MKFLARPYGDESGRRAGREKILKTGDKKEIDPELEKHCLNLEQIRKWERVLQTKNSKMRKNKVKK